MEDWSPSCLREVHVLFSGCTGFQRLGRYADGGFEQEMEEYKRCMSSKVGPGSANWGGFLLMHKVCIAREMT